jgi:hypothetical protein
MMSFYQAGRRSHDPGDPPRCELPAGMAITAEAQWATGDLKYFLEFRADRPHNLDIAELAAEYAEAVRRVCSVCGLNVEPTADRAAAQIIASGGPIDGPWGILALSQLPFPMATPYHSVNQTFDWAETALTKDQRISIMAHEFCHCLGLGHAPAGSGNLMEPVLGLVGWPQAGDTAELVRRYGPPAAPADPAGPPPAVPAAPPPVAGGPPITSLSLVIPAPGYYQYSLGFAEAGPYLLLIIPLGAPDEPATARPGQ